MRARGLVLAAAVLVGVLCRVSTLEGISIFGEPTNVAEERLSLPDPPFPDAPTTRFNARAMAQEMTGDGGSARRVGTRDLDFGPQNCTNLCYQFVGNLPGNMDLYLINSHGKDVIIYYHVQGAYNVTFYSEGLHWDGYSEMATEVLCRNNSVTHIWGAVAAVDYYYYYYAGYNDWTRQNYYYDVVNTTLTLPGGNTKLYIYDMPWKTEFYLKFNQLVVYEAAVLSKFSGGWGVFYDAAGNRMPIPGGVPTTVSGLTFLAPNYTTTLLHWGTATYNPDNWFPFYQYVRTGAYFLYSAQIYPQIYPTATPTCSLSQGATFWLGNSIGISCSLGLSIGVYGGDNPVLNLTAANPSIVQMNDRVANASHLIAYSWSSAILLNEAEMAFELRNADSFSALAVGVGTTTIDVAVISSAPSYAFSRYAFSVGTVTVRPLGQITWFTPNPMNLTVLSIAPMQLALSPAPTLSLTVLFQTSPPGVGIFTPPSMTIPAGATNASFTFQPTVLGAFSFRLICTDTSAREFDCAGSSLPAMSTIASASIGVSMSASVFEGTPEVLSISLSRAPIAGTVLRLTPFIVAGVGVVTFAPSFVEFSSTAPISTSFTLSFQHEGPVTMALTASGNASTPYPQYAAAPNVTTALFKRSTPLFQGFPSTMAKNVGAPFSLLITPPLNGTSITVFPTAPLCAFTPPAVTFSGSSNLQFSMQAATSGNVTVTLTYVGSASIQYNTATAQTFVVEPPGPLVVRPISPIKAWIGVSRNTTVTASPSAGTELIVTPYKLSGSGSATFVPSMMRFSPDVNCLEFQVTPTGSGNVIVGFQIAGSAASEYSTPIPLPLSVLSPNVIEVAPLPAVVPPLQSITLNVSLPTSPQGAAVSVTPLVSLNGSAPTTLPTLTFTAGTTQLSRTFSYLPTAVGPLNFTFELTQSFGQFSQATPVFTTVAIVDKGQIQIALAADASPTFGQDITIDITLVPKPLVALSLSLASNAGTFANEGQISLAAGVDTNTIVLTLAASGAKVINVTSYDPLSQFNLPQPLTFIVAAVAPSAPQGIACSAAQDSLTVVWREPLSDGGSAIASYTVSFTGPSGTAQLVTATSTGTTIGGLQAATDYSLTVVATNAVGDSPASAPVICRTLAAPDAIVVAPPASSSAGESAGIAFGVLIPVLIIAAVIVALLLRRRKQQESARLNPDGATMQLDLSQSQGTKKYVESLLSRRRGSSRIGRGGFAEVYKARGENGEYVAIKTLTDKNPRALAEFHQEVTILSKLGGRNHPNVIELKAFTDDPPCIVMELAEGGTLHSEVKNDPPTPAKRLQYAHQLASGMGFLHTCGIAHLDMKPRNVLIGNKGVLKITDFGVSQSCEEVYITESFAGTVAYASPERFQAGVKLDLKAADVFSYGLTVWYVVTGAEPFTGAMPEAIIDKYKGAPVDAVFLADTAFPDSLWSSFRELLHLCIALVPGSRPTFDDIVIELAQVAWDENVDLSIGGSGSTMAYPNAAGRRPSRGSSVSQAPTVSGGSNLGDTVRSEDAIAVTGRLGNGDRRESSMPAERSASSSAHVTSESGIATTAASPQGGSVLASGRSELETLPVANNT